MKNRMVFRIIIVCVLCAVVNLFIDGNLNLKVFCFKMKFKCVYRCIPEKNMIQ